MAQTNTVIIGAGIIGVSTAFYLSESNQTPADSIHLIEYSPELFASASGYAGGFLARDWFDTPRASLGELSFDLHKELAEKYNGPDKWGYSDSTAFRISNESRVVSSKEDDWLFQGTSRAQTAEVQEYWSGEEGPSWLAKGQDDTISQLSSRATTAQVDPKQLSEFLLATAKERGVHLHHPARTISLSKDLRGELASIRIEKEGSEEMDLPCSKILIAAGVWTPQVFSMLFPSSESKIPVSSLAGHSLAVRSPKWTKSDEAKGCNAVFASGYDGIAPEIFSRIGSEIYVAGLNDPDLKPPQRPGKSPTDPAAVRRLTTITQDLLGYSNESADLSVVRESLCFRPIITNRGSPIVCRLPDQMLGGVETRPSGSGGVFMAVGHGPWGISLSLGTGKVMAELMQGQKTSADITRLSI